MSAAVSCTAIPIILGIVALNFILLHLAPGNEADVLAGEAGSATPQYMEALRARFGLDQPMYLQFLYYMKGMLTLDLGYSFRNNMPVISLMMARLWPTLLLMGTSLVVSISIGVSLGIVAAANVRSWRDTIISVAAVIAYADAAVLDRLDADRPLLRHAGLAADDGDGKRGRFLRRLGSRPGHSVASHPAGAQPFALLHGAFHAADAGDRPRTIGDGLRRHGRREGTDAAAGDAWPCRQERDPSDHYHGGRAGWRPSRWLGDRRIGVRLARLGLLAYQSLFARDYNLLLGIFFFSACLVVWITCSSMSSTLSSIPGSSFASAWEISGVRSLEAICAKPLGSAGRSTTVGGCHCRDFAPLIFRQSPFEMVGQPFQPPFGKYLFGTDSLGRDIAAGLAYGARTSLLIGVLATSVSVAVGILVGGLAGYYGGWLDDVLMRTTEFFQTIPYFILTIILVAILTPSVLTIILAIAVVSWPPVARLVRGDVMAMRNREFVQASICLGTSDLAIIWQDILPNCLSPIIVTGSLMIASAILIEFGFWPSWASATRT